MTDTTRTDDAEGLREAEQAVLVCPRCEGEGGFSDGLDDAACHTICTKCAGNGWIADLAAILSALTSAKPVEPAAPAIPAGMVAWHGGDSAPDDWDGGPVLLADGEMWDYSPMWTHTYGSRNVIAYTRKPAAPAVSGDDAREAWIAGRDAALKQVVEDARLCRHLVHPLFVPAIEGLAETMQPPAILADPACRLATAGDGEKVRVLTEAAQAVVKNAARSYHSRGKDRYIEDSSGECMMLVPHEDWYVLQAALDAAR